MSISLKALYGQVQGLSLSGISVKNFVKSQNGYIEFSNGLLIQWGRGAGWINYPKAFPNTVFSVTSSSQHNAGWNEDTVINGISNAGFCSHLARYGTDFSVSCNWIAIGCLITNSIRSLLGGDLGWLSL